MEIIDELEPEKRGVYGGRLAILVLVVYGYVYRIVIKLFEDDKLFIQVGGGVD